MQTDHKQERTQQGRRQHLNEREVRGVALCNQCNELTEQAAITSCRDIWTEAKAYHENQ